MSTVLRGFVRRAPGKASGGGYADIRVTDMTARDALWWDRRFAPFHSQDRTRADANWLWSVLLPMCHLVQMAKRRFCRPLVIWTRADNQRFVRAGMLIVIEGYPHLDHLERGQSNFAWFLSAADSALLREQFGVSNPPSLGKVLLDCALVLSENAGYQGRIGLHAAARGGLRLFEFYVKYGLQALHPAKPLPAGIARRNDGRFFYASSAAATTLLSRLDPDR